MVTNLIARIKRYLGITSPSREFITAVRAAERRPYVAPAPLPWYAARGPGDRWETPELAAAARHVRRLIRRHWWALAFEPESPIAPSVLKAMATPPEPTSSAFDDACSAMQKLDEFRRLLSAGEVEIDPSAIDDFAERCGVTWDRAKVYAVSSDGSTLPVPVVKLPPSAVVVPVEQCPNCGAVEHECQCGDLRDCW